MKILCVSDLHGKLPQLPPADVLLIAGDLMPTRRHFRDDLYQWRWLKDKWEPWLAKHTFEKVFVVWGNHDWYGYFNHGVYLGDRVSILTDRSEVYGGLKFYGSPWQREFCDWAFNLTEEELAAKSELIPDDTDVLISHGPPYGLGDQVSPRRHTEHLGSPSLISRIDVLSPSLVVYGHIHGGNGVYQHKESTLINAALNDERYEMRQCAWMVTFHGRHVVNVESARYGIQ